MTLDDVRNSCRPLAEIKVHTAVFRMISRDNRYLVIINKGRWGGNSKEKDYSGLS